jgi:hypothetical protein
VLVFAQCPQEELELIAARYKKLAGFDKEMLNQKQ